AFGDFPTLGNMTLDVSGLYLFAAPSTSDEIRARFMHNSQFAGNFRGLESYVFKIIRLARSRALRQNVKSQLPSKELALEGVGPRVRWRRCRSGGLHLLPSHAICQARKAKWPLPNFPNESTPPTVCPRACERRPRRPAWLSPSRAPRHRKEACRTAIGP